MIDMLTAEQDRLGTVETNRVRRQIVAQIDWLKKRIHIIDYDLDRAIKSSPAWQEEADLLKSVRSPSATRSFC